VQNNDYTVLRKFLYGTLTAEADKLVEQYAGRHQIPPVDPIMLIQDAEKDSIELRKDNTSIYDGYSKVPIENQEKFIIFYKDVYPRKFFTVAHELAHYYVLNSPEFQEKISSMQIDGGKETIKRIVERGCNVFAANLLLPQKHLLSFTKKLNEKFTYENLKAICNNFQVSEETLIRRLNEVKALEMPNLLVIFKKTSYFDSRNPKKLRKDIRWRVWHRATPKKIFIPTNIPAEQIGFSIENLASGIKKRSENINLKFFEKKWEEKEFKVRSQYINKDNDTVIVMARILQNETLM